MERIKAERYARWEWNFGESPECEIVKEQRFAGASLSSTSTSGKAALVTCKSSATLRYASSEGTRGKDQRPSVPEEDVAAALAEVDFTQYFLGISEAEFIECLFS